MRVLVAGASGFIGRALVDALVARSHEVIAATRRPVDAAVANVEHLRVDFAFDVEPSRWMARLAGVDAVVNTVGILRETRSQTFERIHVEAPSALFAACAARGIDRVVQLSALGADAGAATGYHRSKRDADAILLARIPTAVCAQPSLVFGAAGGSARWFAMLASMPLVPLIDNGRQKVQPIHIDDLVAALCVLVERGAIEGPRVALVGPTPTDFRRFLYALRSAMRLPRTHALDVPLPLARAAAAVAGRWPGSPLDPDTLSMLERGNVADAAATMRILGRAPRPTGRFIALGEAGMIGMRARLDWLLPVSRFSIALLWIVTGFVSLGVFPVDESYALLDRAGVPAALSPLALHAAAIMDIALGVLVFAVSGSRRQWLWRTQAAVIAVYTMIITWRLPEFWAHPFGPILKNIPLLALLWMLDALEERAAR